MRTQRKSLPKPLVLAVSTVGAFLALLGHAQAQITVEEITVTARRTTEALQDVPLQVSAFTTEMLRGANLVGLRDINNLAPGLNYQGQIGRQGSGRIFFRGLNASSSTAASSSKGSPFLDGIYFASSGQDIPFDYFERIEVMPGPQSALFGRATFGGAINFVTKDPTATWGGRISADVATNADQTFTAFVGGPLMGEKLLGSVFLGYQNYGAPKSWRTPPDALHPNGVQQANTRTYIVAGKLIFNTSDSFSVKLHVMHNYDHDGPYVFERSDTSRRNGRYTQPNGSVVTYPIGVLHVTEHPIGGYPTNTDTYNRIWAMFNYFNIPDPGRYTENWRPSITANWNVADHDITLTGFHEYEWWKQEGDDNDYSAFPGSHTTPQKQVLKGDSVELRITSPRNRRLRYMAGAYYLNQTRTITFSSVTDYRCNTICDPLNNAAIFNPTFVPGAPGSTTGTLVGFNGSVTRINTATFTDTYGLTKDKSVFAAVSFDITDRLTTDLEGRYQSELIVQRSNLAGGFVGSHTFNTFLPRVNVDYKVTDNSHLYALYSIGDNPGGFNTSAFIGLPGTLTTEAEHRTIPEEKLYNYEIGFKAKWLDGRLVTNFSAYHMDWKNQTTSVNFPLPQQSTTFALSVSQGNSRVNGGGIEIVAVPLEGVNVRATISYNDSAYKTWCSTSLFALLGTSSPGKINCVIADGNKLENVPPWSGSLNVSYTHPLVGDWDWLVRGTFQYQDGMWESDMNLLRTEPAKLFNLNLGVENDHFNIEAYCSNCTDIATPYRIIRLVDVRAGPLATTNVSFTGSPRKPREFGVKAAWKF